MAQILARSAPRQGLGARRAKVLVDSGRRAARLARLARSRGSGGYLAFRSHSGTDPPVGVVYRHSMTLLSHCVLQRAHAFSKAVCAGKDSAVRAALYTRMCMFFGAFSVALCAECPWSGARAIAAL